ncbi:mannitol dehydrogenase family protein [Paenarthrobacter ureafaciens]|jgi:fructuronate reductase|uniref:mannitol dehydrogenase family protein n=1 Tax=Paenarthrobacter ureafaciens TaxID=37931 RepID=UPI001E6D6440|nr:mannitol dehydrogenase family protein [Paenarthrobacter ureafaciens]MEC3851461.1 mannitol dehydrogenase family protein [Paenarthrobacter ureafaciens]BCW82785.1 mannitol dehydrogenase [Arthrobacter sp. NicSoilE8]
MSTPRARLSRTTPAAPVRIVHLGLGAFHRSHQAWYTQHAGDAGEWGIASFTGRRPDAATVLAAQDGLFTVVERSDAGDSFEVVGSIVEAVDGADVARFVDLLAAPSTAVVTLTITEAAYGLGAADLPVLLSGGEPTTPIGRLVAGLAARKDHDAGPLAVVSCDNLSDNGNVARNGVLSLAREVDAGLAEWIGANVSFVSTSVDRITPRTTPEDVALVAESCGYLDDAPVVTEPFHNWVLSGDFPAGRPRWEDAGAVFVDDIEPYENRKLWLLNGAHSILAYAGQLRGHATVAEALEDTACRQAVEEFWDEAARHLPGEELQVPEYRTALLERFGNSRIAHHLAQIGVDGSTKLRMRAVPVLRAERGDGRTGAAAARMIAAWSAFVAAHPGGQDPQSEAIAQADLLSGAARTQALLALLDDELARDGAVVQLVHGLSGPFLDGAPPAAAAAGAGGVRSGTAA